MKPKQIRIFHKQDEANKFLLRELTMTITVINIQYSDGGIMIVYVDNQYNK